jgi:hypothetical protein
MRKMTEQNIPEQRMLSLNEIGEVSGGVISEGSHGVQTHVPGRLDPDSSERGTIAGAGFGGIAY